MIAEFKTSLRLITVCMAVIALSLPVTSHGAKISGAKSLGDNTSVQLSAEIVTYASTDFFYVQEANHGVTISNSPAGGLRVKKTAHGFAVGARLDLAGTMRTNEKLERYLDCSSATSKTGTGTVVPWMMANKSVGGADWNYNSSTKAGQRGVDPAGGLNNVGLLVKTTGFVSYVDPGGTFVYIDDGSSVNDGNSVGPLSSTAIGLRVIVPASVTLPKTTQYISVTGVSSLEAVADSAAPAILAQTIMRNDPSTPMSDMDMRYVPGGEFLMGNSGMGDDETDGYPREYPQHPVNVTTFWISKCEVTRSQYNQFIVAGGYSDSSYWSAQGWTWRLSVGRTQPSYWSSTSVWAPYLRPEYTLTSYTQTDNNPVVGVSYYEAEAFCKWAGGRLPTEAEWEKAARWDGTPRIYPWGSSMDKTKLNDWYDTAYPGYRTAPVAQCGTLSFSPYGCADMAGNVWEWTQDWYTSYPGSITPFDKTGAARSLRGGGWYGIYGCRCASRWFAGPHSADNDIGFRLAR